MKSMIELLTDMIEEYSGAVKERPDVIIMDSDSFEKLCDESREYGYVPIGTPYFQGVRVEVDGDIAPGQISVGQSVKHNQHYC